MPHFKWNGRRLSYREHGAGEHDRLEVAPLRREPADVVAVGDVRGVLLDDRAGIKFSGHIMAGRTDDLHATLKGRVIGTRPGERRQERMVDIDNALWVVTHEVVTEDLHVARKHGQVDAHFRQEGGFLLFLSALGFLGDRKNVVRHIVSFGNGFKIRMI